MARSYAKVEAGADLAFQPPDLALYADDAWDIRVSIGGAPLDEAFYFTIEDPNAVHDTIESLLDRYALNPDNRTKLDVASYPELPFMQQELILYRRNHETGLLNVDIYVNNSPVPGPVDITEPADRYLSVCTYHDQTEDYRVLDLVFEPEVPDLTEDDVDRIRAEHGEVFLLLLADYHEGRGGFYVPVVLTDAGAAGEEYAATARDLSRLLGEGLLVLDGQTVPGGAQGVVHVGISAAGEHRIDELARESDEVGATYDPFDSCSIYPPALGVPGGFDVRVQMMGLDGRDVERSVLLRVLADGGDEFFAPDAWIEAYETLSFFSPVVEALAYRTSFTADAIVSLRGVAGGRA